MSFHTLSQQIWIAYLFAISGVAIWRGGWPERAVAVAAIVASRASGLFQDRTDWLDPQWSVLIVDLLFLGVITWVALRSRRYWPLFATAFQLLGVITHMAMMVDRTVNPWAYITAGVIWSYLVMIPLAVGTWNCWRRRGLSSVS